MGALHRGHLSLIEIARTRADVVIASLFVNPTQFAPHEDFNAYPRDEARDTWNCWPKPAVIRSMRPATQGERCTRPASSTHRHRSPEVAAPLEGAFRPNHFAGVATVVAKLLIQALPEVAVFGEKDYQQLQVIRRLALDLDLPVDIVGAPIVREADGLALSSRNIYLSPAERTCRSGSPRRPRRGGGGACGRRGYRGRRAGRQAAAYSAREGFRASTIWKSAIR